MYINELPCICEDMLLRLPKMFIYFHFTVVVQSLEKSIRLYFQQPKTAVERESKRV